MKKYRNLKSGKVYKRHKKVKKSILVKGVKSNVSTTANFNCESFVAVVATGGPGYTVQCYNFPLNYPCHYMHTGATYTNLSVPTVLQNMMASFSLYKVNFLKVSYVPHATYTQDTNTTEAATDNNHVVYAVKDKSNMDLLTTETQALELGHKPMNMADGKTRNFIMRNIKNQWFPCAQYGPASPNTVVNTDTRKEQEFFVQPNAWKCLKLLFPNMYAIVAGAVYGRLYLTWNITVRSANSL